MARTYVRATSAWKCHTVLEQLVVVAWAKSYFYLIELIEQVATNNILTYPNYSTAAPRQPWRVATTTSTTPTSLPVTPPQTSTSKTYRPNPIVVRSSCQFFCGVMNKLHLGSVRLMNPNPTQPFLIVKSIPSCIIPAAYRKAVLLLRHEPMNLTFDVPVWPGPMSHFSRQIFLMESCF